MIKKTCGELLVELLEAYQVDRVFGIPGVHTVELYRGLPATKIHHITPRHEQGAGFMADGYARVSGKPGVCFIITGPGMSNILTAMGQAYADSIPMLVISSVNHRYELALGEGRLHELKNQRSMVEEVCAFSHTLMRVEELPALMARAFAIFGAHRPRPVHIEIPLDVITAEAGHVAVKALMPPSKPHPDPQAIEKAATALLSAKQPLILIGGGCTQASRQSLTKLAEHCAAPVAYTINAKGVFPSTHCLSLGSNQSLVPVREYASKADVVLAVGTELGETDYDVVFDGGFAIDGQLIRIDIDVEQMHRNALADIAIVSDASVALQSLSACVQQAPAVAKEIAEKRYERVKEIRAQLDTDVSVEWRAQHAVLHLIQKVLPNVVIVGDSTQPVYSGNHLYEAQTAHSWFNSSTGYGTLGYALPAAIGAKIATPKRPVVALIGDGGIQFTLPELAAAVEAKVPIIVLLWNNNGYAEIKEYMRRLNLPIIGVDIYSPDFQMLAKGFGCQAVKIDGFEALADALLQGKASAVPYLIEIDEKSDFISDDNGKDKND